MYQRRSVQHVYWKQEPWAMSGGGEEVPGCRLPCRGCGKLARCMCHSVSRQFPQWMSPWTPPLPPSLPCRAEEYGQTAPELAEPYYLYGKALLELARSQSTVLGSGIPGMNASYLLTACLMGVLIKYMYLQYPTRAVTLLMTRVMTRMPLKLMVLMKLLLLPYQVLPTLGKLLDQVQVTKGKPQDQVQVTKGKPLDQVQLTKEKLLDQVQLTKGKPLDQMILMKEKKTNLIWSWRGRYWNWHESSVRSESHIPPQHCTVYIL